MAVLNTVVFCRFNTAGNKNAIFQNFQKGRDMAPSADVLMLPLHLPEWSFDVICLLDHKAIQDGVGLFLSLIESFSDLLRVTCVVEGRARTSSLIPHSPKQ